jgi:ParB/RepB/Spo0J family partition protein
MTVTAPTTILELPVAALIPGFDFRIDDNTEDLAELAASIAEHGVLQPLLVCPMNDHEWEVVAGRRRLAASRQAGLDVVPCIIRELSRDERTDAAIAENIHRRNLSPIEEGLAFAHLRDSGLKQVEIAKRVGRSQTHVCHLLQLLELPPDVRADIHSGKLSYTTALRPDRYQRLGQRQGGASAGRGLGGDEAALVSYWRRRHDRLVGGLYAIQKARPVDADQCLRMIDKLIKLDAEPFEGSAS